MILSESTRVINGKWRFKAVNSKGELEQYSGPFETLPEALDWYVKHGKAFVDMGTALVLSCYKPGAEYVMGEPITREKKYVKPELR